MDLSPGTHGRQGWGRVGSARTFGPCFFVFGYLAFGLAHLVFALASRARECPGAGAGGRWESNWFGASLGANDFDRDTMESFEPDIIGHK